MNFTASLTLCLLKDKLKLVGQSTHFAPNLVTAINSDGPPSKQKSIKLLRTNKSLSCGIFVYRVEKSKVDIHFARLF